MAAAKQAATTYGLSLSAFVRMMIARESRQYEFEAVVRKTHCDNPHARAYLAAIEPAKIQLPEDGEQNLQKLIAHWNQELDKQIEYGFGVNKLAVTVETIVALERLLKTTQRKEG